MSVLSGLTSTYAESVLDKIEGFLRERNTCEKERSYGFSFRISWQGKLDGKAPPKAQRAAEESDGGPGGGACCWRVFAVCQSALAATGGSDGFDVVDVLQDTASLSAAPSSLVPAEDDALWQVAAEGGSDAALKEIASRGANLLAARSGGQRAVEGMRITTALIKVEGVLDQNLANDSSFSVDFNKQFTLHIEVESELNLANKKVEITVPDGLTVVEYPIPERGDMAESVTPESIDQLHSVNNYGGYHPTNGTITYSLKNTAEKNSFNIVLAPDTVLWNRTKEQELKDSLKIEVYTGDRTYQTISATPKITGKYNDTPSDNRAIQTRPQTVPDWREDWCTHGGESALCPAANLDKPGQGLHRYAPVL